MGERISARVEAESGLYRKEPKVYPREVRGRFARLRSIAVWVLLGVFYAFPWLRWDGRQAVLFDLPARKFYVFGLNFWPQDFFLLAMLLIIAGMTLFFFTALAGRLWCGYACPQTVWTEVFLWIERKCEGDRLRRMKLDAAPWSAGKLVRKGSKHASWVVLALWTGFTFVGFFTPIRELADRLVPFDWGPWETFWVLFYGFATWGNAGFLREQVCKYMCPYARFQGAMFDRNTLIIGYDVSRGEPRGSRKRGVPSVLQRQREAEARQTTAVRHARAGLTASPSLEARLSAPLSQGGDPPAQPVDGGCGGVRPLAAPAASQLSPATPAKASAMQSPSMLGDCIDCTLCVQVCPTGIDIRNGLQYECIACGACIDACDQVMDRMGYPRGLIRYSNQNAMDGRPIRVLRPRVLVYGTLLALLLGAFALGVAGRNPLIVDVLRDRNALYRERGDTIENAYTLKIINKDQDAHSYRLSLADAGPVGFAGQPPLVEAGPEQVLELPMTLAAPRDQVAGMRELRIVVEAVDDPEVRYEQETRFFAPSGGP